MSQNTKIEWADHTFNPWTGCTKVSPACDHCYAESWAKRSGTVQWGARQPRRRTTPANWRLPIKWNAQAAAAGMRYRVFCASLADVFDNEVPVQWREDLFNLIAETPSLDWLLLTKRIGNVRAMLDSYCASDGHPGARWDAWPNVWIGATVCNQEEADRDIPKLLEVPARVRFLSMEPLLGPVDITRFLSGLDWVIVGGESGHHARPMHPDWARILRDQCRLAGVPFLFKQWGEWIPRAGTTWSEWIMADGTRHTGSFDTRQHLQSMLPLDSCGIERVGKKAAGRMLDGRTWDEFPLFAEVA